MVITACVDTTARARSMSPSGVLSRTALEELYKNPAYKPYLTAQKGKRKGKLDITLLQYDKAHDIPMFVTRKEGKGRLQTKGRYVGAGTEVELIQPNLQTYNNLQRRVAELLINISIPLSIA